MTQKQQNLANWLSNLFVFVIIIVLVVCTWTFIKGQVDANNAVIAAGTAVLNSVSSDASIQTTVDFQAAIAYLEAAQQTYSENSIIKITSLIYVLSSSIILGYGAKMLRLGASDKEELCKELLLKTEKQFNSSSERILKQQNDVYTAVTVCENAALLALLLTSHFELTSNQVPSTRSDIEDRLEVELTRSLQQFKLFLKYSYKNKDEIIFTKEQTELINKAWSQAQRSVCEYIYPKTANDISCLERSFGRYDQKTVSDILGEIRTYMKLLIR